MVRPVAEYDEKVIKSLIADFHTNRNTKAVVGFKAMFEYATEQFLAGNFPYETSYDFWKRKGRLGKELIDEFNEVRKKTYSIKNGTSYDIVDVSDLISKYGDKPEILEQHFSPMERQLRSLVNELDKAKETISKLESSNFKMRTELQNEKKHSDKLQTLLYQLFTYGPSGATLDNLMNTGTTRTERVSIALQEAFGEPSSFLEELSNKQTQNPSKQSNVVAFQPKDDIEADDDWDL